MQGLAHLASLEAFRARLGPSMQARRTGHSAPRVDAREL